MFKSFTSASIAALGLVILSGCTSSTGEEEVGSSDQAFSESQLIDKTFSGKDLPCGAVYGQAGLPKRTGSNCSIQVTFKRDSMEMVIDGATRLGGRWGCKPETAPTCFYLTSVMDPNDPSSGGLFDYRDGNVVLWWGEGDVRLTPAAATGGTSLAADQRLCGTVSEQRSGLETDGWHMRADNGKQYSLMAAASVALSAGYRCYLGEVKAGFHGEVFVIARADTSAAPSGGGGDAGCDTRICGTTGTQAGRNTFQGENGKAYWLSPNGHAMYANTRYCVTANITDSTVKVCSIN